MSKEYTNISEVQNMSNHDYFEIETPTGKEYSFYVYDDRIEICSRDGKSIKIESGKGISWITIK